MLVVLDTNVVISAFHFLAGAGQQKREQAAEEREFEVAATIYPLY